jgi:hypothetical protein
MDVAALKSAESPVVGPINADPRREDAENLWSSVVWALATCSYKPCVLSALLGAKDGSRSVWKISAPHINGDKQWAGWG